MARNYIRSVPETWLRASPPGEPNVRSNSTLELEMKIWSCRMKTTQEVMSAQQFDALFQSVCNWGVWGGDDQRGTLNHITPETVRKAAAMVRSGRSVSMAVPINKVAGP